jgi:hypothetical protein
VYNACLRSLYRHINKPLADALDARADHPDGVRMAEVASEDDENAAVQRWLDGPPIQRRSFRSCQQARFTLRRAPLKCARPRPTAGAPTTLNKPSRPSSPAPSSFAVTRQSTTPAGRLREPSLPPIHCRRAAAPVDHAALLQATPRSETSDRRVKPAVLALLLLLGAVILGQALALRDARQQRLHKCDVASRLAR